MDRVLDASTTPWQKACVTWYGQGKQQLEYCSGTALWYRGGHAPLPVRWVLTRDPQDEREARAYFSTDQTQSGLSIVTDFMKRWSAEVTFEESRAHLGRETQRQWSDLAIERTTPCLFGLYSLVALLGLHVYPDGNIPLQQTAWYRKSQATFSDGLLGPPKKFTTVRSLAIKKPVKKQLSVGKSYPIQDNLTSCPLLKRTEAALHHAFRSICQR